MIEYIKGKIIEKLYNNILIIDISNIALKVYTDTFTYNKVKLNTIEKLYIETYIRNDIQLYAFSNKEKRLFFNTLTSIKGISSKTALKIISTYKISQLKKFIKNEDIQALTEIPSIGKKTAKLLIFYMKDKLSFIVEEDDDEQNINLNYVYQFLKDMALETSKAKEVIKRLKERIKTKEELDYNILIEKALEILNET